MKLTKEVKQIINRSNNVGELRIFIREYLKIRYAWVNKIEDTEILKDIICLQLFDVINYTLYNNLNNKTNLTGLGEKTIQKLYDCKVYNKEQYDLLIQLKMRKKPPNIRGKHSMSKPKKYKNKQKKEI